MISSRSTVTDVDAVSLTPKYVVTEFVRNYQRTLLEDNASQEWKSVSSVARHEKMFDLKRFYHELVMKVLCQIPSQLHQ